ncbi:hypothetical protein [Mesorhizobium sp. WSM3860]|uniref:hypothetical protein n=1 Tax=Mesorhizobium sp. WSM3860 TaxID=2029403 RepID=UPI001FE132BD|nr:hypothetical protein [Mesorhizobium sp. WSM3860]
MAELFETRVASAADDVEEKGSGSISTNINDLELGFDSSTRQTVGLRFTGVDIPQGAIITSAYIQFQANEVKTGATSLLIKGQDTDDASAFTTTSFNVSSRAKTDASTAWTPDPWTTVSEHGLAERTPDITAIVQEIVSRSGWAALNDMAFVITGTGTRTADSYEYNSASAPQLHIEYILPGSGNPVAFNTPADSDSAANQIDELAAAGAPTGITASATDPDAGSTVTYSLNDSRFAIDASTGVITRSATGTLDFETQTSINLTVTATSSDGSTANQGFTLAVLNSPEPVAFNTPPDANTATNQILQNAAAGTAVGVTASATDPDAGSTVTYSLNDSRFAIDASTGVITRSANGTLNAQSEPTVTLTVTATSSDGSIGTHAFTVGVTASQQPVAFNTPPDSNPDANQIAELAAAGAPTGITASATDPDAGSTVTYSLNDSRFAIDASTGIITRSATGTLDFETQTSINLTVTATSSDGSTANQGFTLAVLDSPEPVAFNTPPDANTAANQILQNAAAGTAVGITASAKDPDAGSTVTYTVDDPRFAINASTGVTTRSSTGTLNAQSEPSVNLTVTATSSDGSIATHPFTVDVTASQQPVAFNTPPDSNPGANQIAELAAAGAPTGITASATDPDAGSTVTYSINDARFAIDSSTGVITRSATGTLDFETQSSINLTVTATSSDGSTANQGFTLAVLNSPEPVAFNTPPDANTAVNQIAQNAAAGTAVGVTASATDPDAGSTVTYTIDDPRFAINASTGVITRSSTGTLNAQSEPSVNLTVTATSSDGSIGTHAFTVGVTGGTTPTIFEARVATAGDDVEEKGSGSISTNVSDLELGFDSSTRQTVGLRFTGIDIPQGAIITSAYIQFQANEVKTGATSLLIKGQDTDDASAFTSTSFNVSSRATTDASTAWTPDPWTTVGAHGLAERTPDLTAIVQEIVNRSGWAALNDMAFLVTGTGTRTADSYEYNSASAPLLHVEYVLPGSGSPVAFNTPPDADPTANQIAELAAAGAPTGITASATDPDAGSTVTYSLNDSRFAISNSGVITRSGTGTLDFETQTSINLTVTATSSDGSTANQGFTLAVLNSPEPVAFNTPPDANTAANQISQNAAAGTAVGITASAKDPDAGSTVTYTIDDTRFAINGSTGVITRSGTGTLNAQSEPSVNLTVTATSSDGSIATHAFTVGVTAGQQPVAFNTPPDSNPGANQIAELAAAGAPTGITASATDPDAGSTVTYSINDPRFAINSSTGVITRSATGTLDFETQSSVNLTVTATSSDGSTANQGFTLAVLNSPEPVAFNTPPDANTAANQILQNAAAGTAVGITASASDPDAGSTVTYTIDDTRFAINASTGVITRSSTGTLNAQSEPTISLHVTATSSDGSTNTHTFNVDVTGGSQLPTSVTLAHTILTSQWSPPSPDPTDIVYISHLGTLLVADSEVEEMSIFTGKNLFQMNLNGTLAGTLTTINFSDEPAGVTYNPANHHLFFSDDTGTKSVYELNPGTDGLYNTSDDIVTSFRTAAFGSTDSESIAYDTNRGVLYLEDGTTHRIYTIAPGQNGKFDGVPSTGGDDVVTSFSVEALGTPSDGGIAYDPVHDLLYVIVARNSVAMVTPTGDLLGTLDISAANPKKPAGLALAPSSDDPSHQMSLYVVDRGVDNDSNPTENDGKIYEFHLNNWLLA